MGCFFIEVIPPKSYKKPAAIKPEGSNTHADCGAGFIIRIQ